MRLLQQRETDAWTEMPETTIHSFVHSPIRPLAATSANLEMVYSVDLHGVPGLGDGEGELPATATELEEGSRESETTTTQHRDSPNYESSHQL